MDREGNASEKSVAGLLHEKEELFQIALQVVEENPAKPRGRCDEEGRISVASLFTWS